MKKNIYRFSILLFASGKLFSQDLAPNIANYEISVSLNTANKFLEGNQKLTWTNTSPVTVKELQFHLYMNAFRDRNSTFMKESGGQLRGDKIEEGNFGNIYISSLKSNRGEKLLGGLEYIQPDDKNVNDRTVIRIPLKFPLEAGETITLEIDFKTKFPKIFARTGYGENDFYLIGQWFPKIGVFEKNKEGDWSWNCHQFHADSEFYADFGKYKVSITLPEKLVVGATGKETQNVKLKGDLKTVIYEADDVHDFAWTASPEFKQFTKTWKHVTLTALMQPEHASQNERYFEAAEKALDYYEGIMGIYPYSTLTMVDPPVRNSGSGGMEYPTFVTCGSYWGIGKWSKFPEIVTVHEFGHQYFQGMLASNESEQAFLDEGFNQYMEGRIMDESYGKGSQLDFLGFTLGDQESSRFAYVSMRFPEISKINAYSWHFPRGTYADLTYGKTAAILFTFENMIGRDKMNEILKAYFLNWKFKHPKFRDFISTANEVTKEDYDWFFDQSFQKSYSCDYSVDTLINADNGASFTLKRKGSFTIPVEVQLSFTDGSTELFIWENKRSEETFKYAKLISSVQIDPRHKNLMDLNLTNNAVSVDPPTSFLLKYTAKTLFWLQHFITGFLFWIG